MSAPEQTPEPEGTHALAGVTVRVSAEIGRARLPVGRVVGFEPGAMVELDRGADDLAELYVGDRRFGGGRLVVVDGEWALRVEWVSGALAEDSLPGTPSVPRVAADYLDR